MVLPVLFEALVRGMVGKRLVVVWWRIVVCLFFFFFFFFFFKWYGTWGCCFRRISRENCLGMLVFVLLAFSERQRLGWI